MMQIIECKNCGKEGIPFGSISVNITLNKSKFCDHCYRSNQETQSYFFCSINCFYQFIESNNGQIKWKDN
jgi:hypothetical protein